MVTHAKGKLYIGDTLVADVHEFDMGVTHFSVNSPGGPLPDLAQFQRDYLTGTFTFDMKFRNRKEAKAFKLFARGTYRKATKLKGK